MLVNNITEELFLSRFPLPYDVRALTPWECYRQGLTLDRTWWLFQSAFTFISDNWGEIIIPKGFITDFASVPPALRSLYDDDGPILLYPSAPHDLVFKPRADGSRGWLPDGRRLTLRQANELLTEAMWYCGASQRDRANVFMAVEIGNQDVKHLFAEEAARAA